jgi:hypothetical protein
MIRTLKMKQTFPVVHFPVSQMFNMMSSCNTDNAQSLTLCMYVSKYALTMANLQQSLLTALQGSVRWGLDHLILDEDRQENVYFC